MKINDLTVSDSSTEIEEVYFDSRKKVKNGLYVCLKGKVDGHNYVREAMSNGAVAIVCEHSVEVDIEQIVVSDTRKALATISAAFYGNPQDKMVFVGITGTNGKTTTSYIVKSILEAHGKKCAVIGTNGCYGDKYYDSELTTPDPPKLYQTLRSLLDADYRYVVMEVSAHAAALDKVYGIPFEVAAFTNLTRDHLDYFGDMDSYGSAKRKFMISGKNAVINVDDDFGRELLDKIPSAVTYGLYNPSDVFGIRIKMSEHGINYILNLMDRIIDVRFALTGKFNVYNTMCAAAICHILGVNDENIKEGIRKLKKVEGRFNIINTTQCSIVIDFAHTPDGLSNVLKALREVTKGRIITVFGCGGNRDSGKREEMGAIASALSDFVVITSDNPRFENPSTIIREIEKGVKVDHVAIENREYAIEYAIKRSNKGDIILVAGKGSEKYQEINGVKHPYSDEEFVLKLVAREGI